LNLAYPFFFANWIKNCILFSRPVSDWSKTVERLVWSGGRRLEGMSTMTPGHLILFSSFTQLQKIANWVKLTGYQS